MSVLMWAEKKIYHLRRESSNQTHSWQKDQPWLLFTFHLHPKNDNYLSEQLLNWFFNEFSKLNFTPDPLLYEHTAPVLPDSPGYLRTPQSPKRVKGPDLVCTWQKINKILSMHTQSTLRTENPMSLNYEHSGDHGRPEVITGVKNLSVLKKFCSRIMVLYSDHNIITYLNFRLKKMA